MADYAQISHDAFARFTVVRRIIKTNETCHYCGTRNDNGKLYNYGILRDDNMSGRPSWDMRNFCSKSCCDAHYL